MVHEIIYFYTKSNIFSSCVPDLSCVPVLV